MMDKAWCCLGEVPFCFLRSSVKFQGHKAKKKVNFDPNWKFPDCNSSLNSLMAMKWCTKLEVAQKRCPITLFMVIHQISRSHGTKKLLILTRIKHFQTVTQVWIHWRHWNDGQSLKWHRRGALLFFKVIHQISRSHGTKNHRFWPELTVSGL